jgi:VWFA-related protein
MKNPLYAVPLFLLLAIPAVSQQPDQTTADDDVVKITSKLVQFDVIVTDKNGDQVTGLGIEDFKILQDGKLQKITNFSYISENSEKDSGSKKRPAVLETRPSATPGTSRRILTFIVDDGNCDATALGVLAMRDALRKFVNDQMLPGDMVSIFQTRSGSSVLQQYSGDKAQLLRTISKIRWYPSSGACIATGADPFDPVRGDGGTSQIVGSIGLMRYIVNGLGKVRGRKIVFFMSNGLPVYSQRGSFSRAFDALRDLTDRANRAGVVFMTIGAGGADTSSAINAADDVLGRGATELRNQRTRQAMTAEDGLYYLADETGGTFYRNQNYLEKPIMTVLDREKGYYLLAYEPDETTFKGKNYNKIEVKLNRPELKVASRAGFLGYTDDERKPKKHTGDSELYEAIVSPLPRAGLSLRLSAFFANTAAAGNFVRSSTHLEGSEISFVDDTSGLKKAVFDVVAVTLNEKDEVVDEFTRTHTIRVEAAAMPMIHENGLVYVTDVPIKKPGSYNFRIAIRDANNRMLGSASQAVEIPDLQRKDLFLSGLNVTKATSDGKFALTTEVKPENALTLIASGAVPAVRKFHKGDILAYGYTIYNAKMDATSVKPNLTIKLNLYREGQLLSEGHPQPADLEKQADWSRINDYGYLRLNESIVPGNYAVQITVTDLNGKKSAARSEWIDFEVVP